MNKRAVIVFLLLSAAVVFTPVFLSPGQEHQSVEKSLWELELQRIKELYQLTDLFGDQIWPGFSTRKLPIVLNYKGLQEVLINHPQPPKEFRVFKDVELDGQTIMIRDGCTHYVSLGGVLRIGGIRTAAGAVPGTDSGTEKYISMMLHECFHVFQDHFWKPASGRWASFPIFDLSQAALIGLENRILHMAVQQEEAKEIHRLAKMFVAVRSQRRQSLTEEVRRCEDRENFSEGTAFYAETRLSQLLQQPGERKSPLVRHDPDYKGYSEAGKIFHSYLEDILPPKDKPVTLGHHIYQNGMAQALLLDRVRPGWKKEMNTKGITQFKLLERQFPLEEDEITALVAAAKDKFDYKKIRAQQESLIREQITTVHGYLDTPGRRYRVYYMENPSWFKWKPRKPSYLLPGKHLSKTQRETALADGNKMADEYMEVMVLVNGIERLETGDLVFEGGQVPVIVWSNLDYFEWIDSSPAADKSDMKIQALQQEKDIYTNLILTTDGFVLRVNRARIIQSDNIVEIHPVPKGTRGLAPLSNNSIYSIYQVQH
jgi:hypothetical protein